MITTSELMHEDNEVLRINKGSFSDVVERFKKQNEIVQIPNDLTDSDVSYSLTDSDVSDSELTDIPNRSISSATSSESWS